jgi:formylglycine-generating enzyme required for sulfatase activity
MPGYARSDSVERFELQVPTCQASHADLIDIPAGPFLYGGPGDPPSQYYGQPDYTEPEQVISLPAFAIDRTEVSNGAYAPFARMEAITGYPAPIYSDDTVHAHDGDPRYPVTEIDAYQAEAYCAYLGKHLPGDHQWVKALRGGITLDGAPNPAPRRLYPWGNESRPGCANLAGTTDGFRWVAPVDALPCGASPYGVLQLAGNVQEWISRAGQTDATSPLHVVRGGGADSPPELEHATALFRNAKDPRSFNYSIGLRCVAADHGTPRHTRSNPSRSSSTYLHR